MIKRTVEFTVSDGAVMPSVPLFGGVKGEHNATRLRVLLTNDVYEAGDTIRLSFTTGDGSILSSELFEAEEVALHENGACIEYDLPQLLTIGAGQLCVRVVTSSMNARYEEDQTDRSPEMVLYFDEAEVENGTLFWTGVSEMLARTVTTKNTAVKAQADAQKAQTVAVDAANAARNYMIEANQASAEALVHKQDAEAACGEAQDAKTAAANAARAAWQYQASASEEASYALECKQGAEAARDEAIDTVALTMRYIGEVSTGAVLGDITTPAVRDVYYVTAYERFYMWTGAEWKPLGTGGGSGNVSQFKGEITSDGLGNVIAQKGDMYIVVYPDEHREIAIAEADTSSTVGTPWFTIPDATRVDAIIRTLWESNATQDVRISDLEKGGTGTGGSGLSSTEKTLLINILRNGVFNSNQSANITALENALGSGDIEPDTPVEPDKKTYPVLYNLTFVSVGNSISSIVEGNAYTTTIIANDGYTLDSVVVLMGGVDITATAYANGVITIGNVSGNITITANAIKKDAPSQWIYDEANWVEDGKYINTNAEIADKPSSISSYMYYDIPVVEGQVVSLVMPNGACHVRVRNNTTNKMLSQGSYSTENNYSHTFTIPSGCSGITINNYHTSNQKAYKATISIS